MKILLLLCSLVYGQDTLYHHGPQGDSIAVLCEYDDTMVVLKAGNYLCTSDTIMYVDSMCAPSIFDMDFSRDSVWTERGNIRELSRADLIQVVLWMNHSSFERDSVHRAEEKRLLDGWNRCARDHDKILKAYTEYAERVACWKREALNLLSLQKKLKKIERLEFRPNLVREALTQ